jgi:hypothetical protein
MTTHGGKNMFQQILVAGVTGGMIVFLIGIFAFVYLEPQYWNWYGFPATYTIARVCGGVATWTISGAAMAAIVR